MKYTVPSADGEFLFEPPREEAPRLIEWNHSLLESYDFEVGGVSFQRLRSAARENVAEQAQRRLSDGLRTVVGAHQPGLHGPGILYKHAVLQEFSRANLSVNFVVDSDVCDGVSARIPYLRVSVVGLKEVVIFPNAGGLVFEKAPAPPKREVDERYDEIEELLRSVRRRGMLTAFREFRAIHERVYREGDSLANVLTAYRRGYYPTPGVCESSISTISENREFLVYACDIINKIEGFHEAYNLSLREHRRLHRIKNDANPFPDLKRQGGLWELPFWGLDSSGRRHRLFGVREKGELLVAFGDGSGRMSPVSPEALLTLHIRPRAVCLTTFLRLFVADLFVHGVGGGNYDQVTDRIIEAYYRVPAPRYVVCSRTKLLCGRQGASLKQKSATLREKLRYMKQHPEKFATDYDSLAEEALQILSWKPKPTAEQHIRLSELRRALLSKMAGRLASVEGKLAEVKEALRRQASLHRRDLPYFVYPRSKL